MDNKVDYSQVVQSIRDLTRTYKPPPSKVYSFVEWFCKRYRVERGHQSELIKIVRSEIEKMIAEQSE